MPRSPLVGAREDVKLLVLRNIRSFLSNKKTPDVFQGFFLNLLTFLNLEEDLPDAKGWVNSKSLQHLICTI